MTARPTRGAHAATAVTARPARGALRRTVTESPLTRRALAAALAVAARHGLRCDEPRILRDASNLLVLLHPAPVVARVTTVTSTFRPGDAWLAREVAIASYLAAAGAPVVAPSADPPPGPHHEDGLVLSFWPYVDEGRRELDAREAGRRLRACHEALHDFPGELPRLAVLDEAERILAALLADGTLGADDEALLRRAGDAVRGRVERLGLPLQAIHGDAHLTNVITGPDGPLWNDWEDCFRGPRGWDLGCLVATARAFGRDPAPGEAALAGYGPPAIDDDALDVFVDARRFQGVAVGLLMAREQPTEERRARATSMLAWYRERS